MFLVEFAICVILFLFLFFLFVSTITYSLHGYIHNNHLLKVENLNMYSLPPPPILHLFVLDSSLHYYIILLQAGFFIFPKWYHIHLRQNVCVNYFSWAVICLPMKIE